MIETVGRLELEIPRSQGTIKLCTYHDVCCGIVRLQLLLSCGVVVVGVWWGESQASRAYVRASSEPPPSRVHKCFTASNHEHFPTCDFLWIEIGGNHPS